MFSDIYLCRVDIISAELQDTNNDTLCVVIISVVPVDTAMALKLDAETRSSDIGIR